MTGVVVVLWLVAGTAGGEPVPADEPGQRWLGFGPEAGLFGIGSAIHAGGPIYGAPMEASGIVSSAPTASVMVAAHRSHTRTTGGED
ncbi:MAG TPA: hypothetical protein VHN14_07730 [Kofleriaceae bacterium]|jgi:hypothetical protein|nr:hypothetical protein [Kofleriaceae bacterium]